MKTSLPVSLLYVGICATLAHGSYIDRRACAKTNIYRTLERLQRESSFCQILLSPSPTVTIPSSIAATPLQTLSSACNCIVATLPTTSRASTTSTTSAAVSTCPSQIVTFTETIPASTITVPASTITESCTSTSTRSVIPTSYSFGFEEPSKLWGGGTKCPQSPREDFCALGEHEASSEAHTGSWYYRWEFWLANPSEYGFRMGNKKALQVLQNTEYDFTIWHKRVGGGSQVSCDMDAWVSTGGQTEIGGTGTVQSGFALGMVRMVSTEAWSSSTTRFNTRSTTDLSVFISAFCTCNASNRYCGKIQIGFDDISFIPVATT